MIPVGNSKFSNINRKNRVVPVCTGRARCALYEDEKQVSFQEYGYHYRAENGAIDARETKSERTESDQNWN